MKPRPDGCAGTSQTTWRPSLLGTITAPVLLMVGAEDQFVSLEGIRASMDLFETTPQLIVHERSGHIAFLEEQETYLTGFTGFTGFTASLR